MLKIKNLKCKFSNKKKHGANKIDIIKNNLTEENYIKTTKKSQFLNKIFKMMMCVIVCCFSHA